MADITDKFFELIQISLDNREGFKHPPSENEWGMLFQVSGERTKGIYSV